MSTAPRNPEDQASHEKRMLSNHPQLMTVTHTAFLGNRVPQPIKDRMSLGTDFETHANWQGYNQEPAAKDFVVRKACTITLRREVQVTH